MTDYDLVEERTYRIVADGDCVGDVVYHEGTEQWVVRLEGENDRSFDEYDEVIKYLDEYFDDDADCYRFFDGDKKYRVWFDDAQWVAQISYEDNDRIAVQAEFETEDEGIKWLHEMKESGLY